MLTGWARRTFSVLLKPIAGIFARLGVSPNALTLVGLLLQALVAFVLATGQLRLGGILLIFFAAFDALDGSLARMTGRVSRFGSLLDSTVDRYAEGLTLLGLLIYANQQGRSDQIVLIYVTIVGSLLVSYVRAKAESLNIPCTVGILTRAERVALLILGLIFSQWRPVAALPDFLTLVLWLMAIFSNFTALQRVWAVRQATAGE